VLIFGGSFNAARGAVMSTDNAYLQADMVGVSSDVSGIVLELTVHGNRKVAKSGVLFKACVTKFDPWTGLGADRE
jgi:membrane fusion protein, multidrug efflux system